MEAEISPHRVWGAILSHLALESCCHLVVRLGMHRRPFRSKDLAPPAGRVWFCSYEVKPRVRGLPYMLGSLGLPVWIMNVVSPGDLRGLDSICRTKEQPWALQWLDPFRARWAHGTGLGSEYRILRGREGQVCPWSHPHKLPSHREPYRPTYRRTTHMNPYTLFPVLRHLSQAHEAGGWRCCREFQAGPQGWACGF